MQQVPFPFTWHVHGQTIKLIRPRRILKGKNALSCSSVLGGHQYQSKMATSKPFFTVQRGRAIANCCNILCVSGRSRPKLQGSSSNLTTTYQEEFMIGTSDCRALRLPSLVIFLFRPFALDNPTLRNVGTIGGSERLSTGQL